MKKNIITGLDIGTSSIRVVTAQLVDRQAVQILGIGETPAQGLSKGNIVDLEEVVASLSEALEKAERMTGLPIERAVVGINGVHVKVIESKGVVAVSRANGTVELPDTERVLE